MPNPTADRAFDAFFRSPHSLREIAQRAGVSVQYLSDLQHGRRRLSAALTIKLDMAMPEVYWPGIFLQQALDDLQEERRKLDG